MRFALVTGVQTCALPIYPGWLKHVAGHPGEVLTLGGVPVVAHCRTAEERALVDAAMREDRPLPAGTSMKVIAHESGVQAINSELRKREPPFALKLAPSDVRAAERASSFGAYKGVTDVLTKYLWPNGRWSSCGCRRASACRTIW